MIVWISFAMQIKLWAWFIILFTSVPLLVLTYLFFAGKIPPVEEPRVELAFYASVLTLFAGLNWGMLIWQEEHEIFFGVYSISSNVLLPLLAWLSALMLSIPLALAICAFCFICQFCLDIYYARSNLMPVWFYNPRMIVSVIAMSGLISSVVRLLEIN